MNSVFSLPVLFVSGFPFSLGRFCVHFLLVAFCFSFFHSLSLCPSPVCRGVCGVMVLGLFSIGDFSCSLLLSLSCLSVSVYGVRCSR